MPADGNGIPRQAHVSAEPAATEQGRIKRTWLDRAPPRLGKARRHVDPAAEAMSHNPNLSPPLHFEDDN